MFHFHLSVRSSWIFPILELCTVYQPPSFSQPYVPLDDIAEVRVLAISQIIETVSSVNLGAEFAVLSLVARGQVEAEEEDDEDEESVASEVNGQSLAITGLVTVEEDLRTGGITGAPSEEVHGDADGLLRLSTDVSGQHGHAETLCSPEREDYPVTDEEAGTSSVVLVLDGHDDDSTNERTTQYVRTK